MYEAESSLEQALCKEVVFTGDSASMIAARDSIMDFVHLHDVGEQVEIDILVALQEALANAVSHGCRNDPGKTVRCTVTIDSSAITIVIRDPGPGFDTAAAGDSAEDGTNLTQHGRGIFLMRSLMDEVHYRRGGSEVELKKTRRAA